MIEQIPQSLDKFRTYKRQGLVWLAWGEEMGELAKEEAEYHDNFEEDADEVHQLKAWRNVYYHRIIQNKIKELPKGSKILEIGAGSGVDAKELKEEYNLTLTDVSPKTLERLANKLGKPNIDYIAADGQNLPFKDSYFDGLYMVATWHHFEDPKKALEEAWRVLKPGGLLVIGVEPNSFYHKPIKWLRPILSKISKTAEGSHADEEMTGFSSKQIKKIFGDDWDDMEIIPMWLLAGWVHYGLEFFYRVFKLKKRIKLPLRLEKAIVAMDEINFLFPLSKYFCWHWIVFARRKR